MTDARAMRRKERFEAKMAREYGKDWRDNSKVRKTSADRIIENSMNNKFKHEKPFMSFYSRGNFKTPYITSIHNPVDDQIQSGS